VPELRHDPLSGRSVLVAPERGDRPFSPLVGGPAPDAECPFCPGHESLTPPEVYRTGPGGPDTPGWRVRVVPNRYPVVGGDHPGPGATGAHEVVVFSPSHERSLGRLSDGEAAEVLTVVRDRVRAHLGSGRSFVQAIVNHGRAAGASLAHPHAQVVALDLVPSAVEAALDRFDTAGVDLVAAAAADTVGSELAVLDGPAPAWCPVASGAPFEMLVAHRSTRARFDEATDAEVAVVARSTRDALARLHAVVGEVPYNLVVHTAPPARRARFFHWYVEIVPRLSTPAGFEHGTGILVNPVAPETAARALRTAPTA
jgi:UDPglucose--hexose-1-phosphate uridylyltransferase